MSETATSEQNNGFADLYEEFIVPTMSAQWAPPVADAAGLKHGDRVLDVGCGTGILSREAAGRVGSDGHVSGLDISEEMLAVARRIRPDIDWHQGDACALPFDDASFDAVVSQFALMFVADQMAALREMWRVLASGGRLSVAVWWQSAGYPILADIARERINGEVAAALMDPFCFGDGDELVKLFRSSGIGTAKVHSHEGWARFPSIDEFVRIEIKGWVDGQLEGGMDEGDYSALLVDARTRLAHFCTADGEAMIPMDAHIVTAEKN